MRADPVFCPTPRRYTWDDFECHQRRNPNLMNFPLMPPLPKGEIPNEENFVMMIDSLLEKYDSVPDPSIVLTCKFLSLFKDCIQGFAELQHQKIMLSQFNNIDMGLAFDLQIGPLGDQIWGYYAHLQHMEAHYMITWEEIMATEFIYFPNSVFKQGAGPISLRYMALRKANTSAVYKKLELTVDELARQREIASNIERPWQADIDR